MAMAEHLRFVGSIREVTVNRTAGIWFACFCVEDGQEPPPVKEGPTIGVDVGVGVMATCSDGTLVENSKALPTSLKRLRRLDKAIARSGEGARQSQSLPPQGTAVYQAKETPCQDSQRQEQQPSPGHHGDSQVGGKSGGGDPERGGDDPQPAAGPGHC